MALYQLPKKYLTLLMLLVYQLFGLLKVIYHLKINNFVCILYAKNANLKMLNKVIK
jgi:hypothetical protein